MNSQRRKALQVVFDTISEAHETLEVLKEEEEEYRDNIPENFQGTERYEKAENACEILDTAVSSLEEAVNAIEEVINL